MKRAYRKEPNKRLEPTRASHNLAKSGWRKVAEEGSLGQLNLVGSLVFGRYELPRILRLRYRWHGRGAHRMETAKDEVRRILDALPDDATLEEIQYRLYVRQGIDVGLRDITEGRTLSQEEVEDRVARWIGK